MVSQHIDSFLQLWNAEMLRSVDMFLGEKPELSYAEAAAVHDDDLTNYLWWKQVIEGTGKFAVWTGAPEPAWVALGGNDEADRGAAKQTYLDIVRQAYEGLVGSINARVAKPVSSGPGGAESLASVSSLLIWEISIKLKGQALPKLLLALDKTAVEAIRLTLDPESEDSQTPGPSAGGTSAMLERLMQIELPLAVALGQAVLPIHEVLKMTPGSLIELNRTVDDYVDLVVHGTVVARGEIVSVKGNYGVRIKQIISREDRMALRASQGRSIS